MALLTKLKMPIIALPPVALALLVLLGALGVRPNEVSGAAQIWVGRVAELEQDGLPPSFVAARGDEPLPVLITSGTAQAVTAGSRLEISWPASQAEAGRLVVAFDAAQERLYLLDPLTGELYTANPGSQTIQTAGVIAAAVGSRALAVDGGHNGADMTTTASGLWVERADPLPDERVRSGPRVGMGKRVLEPWLSMPWRWWVADNPYVST